LPERKSRKPFLEHHVVCPGCGKTLRIVAIRRVITPATPAEIELDVSAELETQTTLPVAPVSTPQEDS